MKSLVDPISSNEWCHLLKKKVTFIYIYIPPKVPDPSLKRKDNTSKIG